MPRPRVLSFMSQWSNGPPRSPTSSQPASPRTPTKPEGAVPFNSPTSSPAPPRASGERPSSRPTSMVQSYQPPTMDIPQDTLPELQPIFSYINAHSNKLYQEGYFLKLHDLDGRGRPSTDRVWNECFAQLVGTVLSLWDAAQLDAAGEDGEVVPTFINLTDASLKMIESLPMNGVSGQSLQNLLSISTAANNRYLLHFNSLHSLTQWTAGIRLAMYEQTTLQEAYTGSIIAGKGKYLNNIRTIMAPSRFPTEDWARVRFGAGTPWRRLWCVITPPDDKELQKAQKIQKKRSAYDRSAPVVKGDIKFYESRKVTKKSTPVASITDAYAAYAIYPQSKALIDQSTLVKVEGIVNVHQGQESTAEGFLFVMPEVHAAVSGFEIMLRWLLPVFDTFSLYGRPTRLVADVLDTRSLMFAMPSNRRFGYLELIDVAGLVHTDGSSKWSEREWRKQMKNLTSRRMNSSSTHGRAGTESSHQRAVSNSNLPQSGSRSSINLPPRSGVKFGTEDGVHSSSSSRRDSPGTYGDGPYPSPARPADGGLAVPGPWASPSRHQRAVSDQPPPTGRRGGSPSRPSPERANEQRETPPPPPPPHAGNSFAPGQDQFYPVQQQWESAGPPDRAYPPQNGYAPGPQRIEDMTGPDGQPYVPVQQPPRMAHRGSAVPPFRPNQMPEIRSANSAIDAATLAQLREVNANAPNEAFDRRESVDRRERAAHERQYSQDDSAVYSFSDQGPYAAAMPMRGGPPPAPSQPPQTTGRRLPTIPGTPATEINNFELDLSQQGSRSGPPSRDRSTGGGGGSILRKPLPGTR